MSDLETLDAGDLATTHGETRNGHGAYHSLDNQSMALNSHLGDHADVSLLR